MTSSSPEPEQCEWCLVGMAHRKGGPTTIPYGEPDSEGRQVVVFVPELPYWECDTCGEGMIKGEEGEQLIDDAIAAYLSIHAERV